MSTEMDAVIVSADTPGMTLECVGTLRGEPGLSVTVVVNGRDVQARRELREGMEEGEGLIELEEPVGFARACDLGAQAGEAGLVLFLNSDILALPGSIGRLRKALERDPRSVAAGGRLVDPESLATQPGYRPRRFPGLLSLLVIVTGIEGRWPSNPVTRHWQSLELDESHSQRVEQPAAAALLVRRESFEAVGGFDERFWFWFEDCDLLKRLSGLGGILWVPSAPFRHVGGASFSKWSRVERIRSQHQGMLQYGASHFGPWRRAALGAATMGASLAWMARLGREDVEERKAMRDILRAAGALALGRPLPAIAGP